MTRGKGYGSRYDKFTPNAVDAARDSARSYGVQLKYGASFCAKCQKEKPAKGCVKQRGMFICAECRGNKGEQA